MSCERYDSALRDDACGAQIDADVAAHLGVCEVCRERVDRERRLLRDVEEQLQLLLQVQPSAGFGPRVMAHVAHSASRRRRALWWSLAGAAAAVLAIASVGSVRFGVASRDYELAERQAVAAAPPRSPRAAADTLPSTMESRPRPSEVPISTGSPRRAAWPAGGGERVHPVESPSVLVPPGRVEALNRYLALLRRGAVDTTVLAHSDAAAAAGPAVRTPADLTIAPLSIELLAVQDVDTDIAPEPDALEFAPDEEGVQ